jgi:hypothetical protein
LKIDDPSRLVAGQVSLFDQDFPDPLRFPVETLLFPLDFETFQDPVGGDELFSDRELAEREVLPVQSFRCDGVRHEFAANLQKRSKIRVSTICPAAIIAGRDGISTGGELSEKSKSPTVNTGTSRLSPLVWIQRPINSRLFFFGSCLL